MNRTAVTEGFSSLPEHHKALLESSCDWAFVTDKDFTICYCHKCRSAIYEILPKNLVGKSLANFFPTESRDQIMAGLHPDNILYNKGLETVYFDPMSGLHLLKIIRLEKKTEPAGGFCVTIRRISQEGLGLIRQAVYGDSALTMDKHISIQLKQQKLIADLSAEFTKTTNIDHLFPYTIQALGDFLKVNRCSIFRHDAENKTYSIIYEWCAPGIASTKDLLQNIPYNEEDEGFIQLTTRPYIAVNDTFQYSGEAYKVQRESGVHAFVDLPIIVGGNFWGFLGADYSSGPHYWTESEFHMLQTISVIMGTSLEKKEMEDKLHDAFSKLKQIVNNYPGIIWSLSNDHEISLFEGSVLKDFEIDTKFLQGVRLEESRNDFLISEMLKSHQTTLSGGDQSYYFDIAGRHFTCKTTLLRALDGAVSGTMGVALDVTDMREMQNRLENAIKEAEQASQAKTEFLSRMSHEIRTPMNAIIGMNEIAKKSNDPERIQYCLGKIEKASRQLLGLINDILDLSKIESGKMEIVLAKFDYEKMLQTVYGVVQPRVEEKNLEFTFDLDDLYECSIVSDELHLSQVFTNLLSNAVKFTPEGGKINLKSRFLNKTETGALLRVEIQDTGIGISEENQKKLFQSFEQADGSITRRFGGTGLGLSICKKIMDLMGGSIGVESLPGQGSCFFFQVQTSFEAPVIPRKQNVPDLRDMRILVVDDNPDVLDYCSNTIKGFYMHCDTAMGGEEAIKLVEQSKQDENPYNIIFIDWKMPGLDGIQTAQAILGKVSPETIVIMISASDWAELRPQANEIGISRFLPKPLLPSALFNTIVELSGKTRNKTSVQESDISYRWDDKTILLVEDIEINQEILCSLLEPTGLKIDCAVNGRDALEQYRGNGSKYDLILMDVQMPEMDGYEATKQIRESGYENAKDLPIIAMTANAFAEDVQKCLAAGMNSHVAKPIDVNELMSTLHRYFSESSGSRR